MHRRMIENNVNDAATSDHLIFHSRSWEPVGLNAVAGSPRHHLRHSRAFPGEQKPVLIFQALQPARRDVVLDWRRRARPVLVFS